MDHTLETFRRIGVNPQEYLPEKSIWVLREFLAGYGWRASSEGNNTVLTTLYAHFLDWLTKHFSLDGGSQSVYGIVSSYSDGPENAFDNFYRLFRVFYETSVFEPATFDSKHPKPQKMDVIEILRAIRKRPELWIGHPHFSGIVAYLVGHERAGVDLGLSESADELFYEEFKKWIVEEKLPVGQARPWFKRIEFYSFHDGGTGETGAYTLFFKLLEQFADLQGGKGVFQANT